MIEEVKQVLSLVQSAWQASKLSQANEINFLLTKALEESPVEEECKGAVSAPDLGEGDEPILNILKSINDSLPWKTPDFLQKEVLRPLGGTQDIDLARDSIKTAVLVGPPGTGARYNSTQLAMGITWIAPGTLYPQHQMHQAETYQVISGASSWGPSPKDFSPLSPGDFISFVPAEPHAVQVPGDQPLVAVFGWTGNLAGDHWFSNPEVGGFDIQDFAAYTDGKGMHASDYYDAIAHNYDGMLRGWGWNMPEAVVDTLEKGLEILDVKLKGKSVMDLGCGSGLVGLALQARGVTDIEGVDFSQKQLDTAETRGCYKSTQKVDLLKPLPLPSNNWEITICSGCSSYLNPGVLKEWCRVTKVGGVVAFSHKNTMLGAYEEEQDAMEAAGLWEKVYVSEKLTYLPALRDPKQDYAKVYVYKKKKLHMGEQNGFH